MDFTDLDDDSQQHVVLPSEDSQQRIARPSEDSLSPEAARVKEELEKQVVYQSPENRAGGVQKVNYSHEDMIDTIIANPRISQAELALRYGYTPGWVSRIVSSDAFKLMFAKRRTQLIDPIILQETEERFRALVHASIDKLQEKIEDAPLDGLVKVMDVASRAMGYGVSKNQVNISNTQYVVALPSQAPDSQTWAEKYAANMRDITPIADSQQP